MSQHIWEVKVKNTPLLKKKCNHCDSSRFRCSDKFRLNAQKKNIDIWLIYRCVQCNNRYNMTLFSRIRTESISKELFNQLSENDANTAWEYAFSHETRRKNNVDADLESVEYEILYDDTWTEDTICSGNEMITFTIKNLFDFNLRISSVIRTCLKISSSTLDRLINEEAISVDGRALQKKHRVRNGDIVQVNAEQLRRLYQDIR
ncbi:hypothetical protein C1637_23835 [Chryseobacterium lactis]|uniref:DUF1062 domain-containing protein n=1 Tax=Chryseobacterium lactis TaxID=1241981 RepID=A0A3G6RKF3_CHRLC|nr:DUF1062 domain-containing protein [Chryseobacterium lactis]AZA83294.1 DUF1062 domain-containing protein [Chryseobacterium lactis]AZB03679.1 DUF1062 domain-containing protein [Chryseobacterium lactis]PNW11113.1 hypothetical protein C1637_23835 [Chryseobacterium lactis]